MRHYAKLLGLRAWKILWRPFWAIIVGVGVVYTFLQVVAHLLAERLVSMFDALYQWDPFYQWWYVPLAVIILSIFLRAGYELWRDEKQAREKLGAENQALKEELKEIQSNTGKISTRQFQKENEHLRAQVEQWTAQMPLPGDEALTERAQQRSDSLFRFVREREESAPPDGPIQLSDTFWSTLKENIAHPRTQERTNFHNETRRQYSDLYGADVTALLDAVEMRRWLDPKERKKLEGNIANRYMDPAPCIRQLAERLAAIGKRL